MPINRFVTGFRAVRIASALSLALITGGGAHLALASHEERFAGNVVAINGDTVLLEDANGAFQGVVLSDTTNIVPNGHDLQLGLWVRAEGSTGSDGALHAEKLKVWDDNTSNSDDQNKVEGTIVAVNGNVALVEKENGDLQGVVLPDGTVAAVGDRIEARGTFNSDGALEANDVEIAGEDDNNNQNDNEAPNGFDDEIEGIVISQDGNTVTIRDEDGVDHEVKLQDGVTLPVGKKVELGVNTDADGNLVSTDVEIDLEDQGDHHGQGDNSGPGNGGDVENENDNGVPGDGVENENDNGNSGPGNGGVENDNSNSGPGNGHEDENDNTGTGPVDNGNDNTGTGEIENENDNSGQGEVENDNGGGEDDHENDNGNSGSGGGNDNSGGEDDGDHSGHGGDD